jgi:hypothetical protein
MASGALSGEAQKSALEGAAEAKAKENSRDAARTARPPAPTAAHTPVLRPPRDGEASGVGLSLDLVDVLGR